MNIEKLAGNMATAADPTLAAMLKKINELVVEANETLQSQVRIRNDMADIKKEVHELKLRLMHSG